MKNFIIRTISGILIFFLVLFFSIKGGLFLLCATMLLTGIASYEFHKAMEKLGLVYPLSLQVILGLLLMLAAYLGNQNYYLLVISLVILSAFISFSLGNKYRANDMMAFVFAFFYCNFLMSFFLLFDNYLEIFVVYLCAWGTDTFAYLSGMFFGKTKLIEKTSPNKTVEGSIGGTISAMVLVEIYALFFNLGNYLTWPLIAALVSIISQIGDLSASYLKRKAGIKDFGKVILGHGGVLDRFDSVLFALPLTYFLIKLIGGIYA